MEDLRKIIDTATAVQWPQPETARLAELCELHSGLLPKEWMSKIISKIETIQSENQRFREALEQMIDEGAGRHLYDTFYLGIARGALEDENE